MNSSTLLSIRNLTKKFSLTRGVFDLNFSINAGQITGFIGPNGAGKTTTVKLILQQLYRDSGVIELFGKQINSHNDFIQFANYIGYLPGEVVFPDIAVATLIHYIEHLAQANRNEIARLVKLFELETKVRFSQLSLGNKKKIGIIHALANQPKLLILDEPTNSLDPLMQNHLINELKKLEEKGSAIFFSSHILSEVEKLSDNLMFIREGKIVINDTKGNILKKSFRIVRINTSNTSFIKKNSARFPFKAIKLNEYSLITEHYLEAVKLLLENKINDFYLEQPTLEDIFISEYSNNSEKNVII